MNGKCRFLYLSGQLGPGGSERQLHNLLKGMDRERYQPEVVVWNLTEADPYVSKIRALGVPLHSFPSSWPAAMKFRNLCRIVRHSKPAVVHSFSFYLNFAVFGATLGTKSIAIGAVRSDFDWARRETGSLFGRLSARWPRRQIFNSSSGAQTIHNSRSLFVPGECLVVHNGLDLESFRYLPLDVTQKTQIIGIGSLFPVKRWDRVVAAASSLKHMGFKFSIRIVGDGPLRESLNQKSRDLGVDDRIDFVGYVDHVPTLLAESTFLVHASDHEGCPNAVMEAMACGRAVVTTSVGDVPCLVKDGQTGFLVQCGDDDMLIERMATLIRDRGLCQSMGQAGRIIAEREFGLDSFVTRTLDSYRVAGWKESL